MNNINFERDNKYVLNIAANIYKYINKTNIIDLIYKI